MLASVAACGGTSGDGGGDAGVFIAQASDFDGFRSWKTYNEPTSGADGQTHSGGPRIEHIQPVPPHGSTSFPVGTIIVKEVPGQSQIFAMVKRGGGYNSSGANGWEWFEIADDGHGGEDIVWQGALAPSNSAYAGDPTVCNDCHAMSAANDFVASSALSLSSF